MSKRDPGLLVEDIADAIEKINQYIIGMTIDTFKEDSKTSDAVVRNLEIIGEAVSKLPAIYKEAHKNVPWHQIAGLRNRIVHDYFGIDLEMIWYIVTSDLPEFKEIIQKLID
jgi:uncharacterized protein with HEPN domain